MTSKMIVALSFLLAGSAAYAQERLDIRDIATIDGEEILWMNHVEATAYCARQGRELPSLAQYRAIPRATAAAMPNVTRIMGGRARSYMFWTRTLASDRNNAYVFSLATGHFDTADRTYEYPAYATRCVSVRR